MTRYCKQIEFFCCLRSHFHNGTGYGSSWYNVQPSLRRCSGTNCVQLKQYRCIEYRREKKCTAQLAESYEGGDLGCSKFSNLNRIKACNPQFSILFHGIAGQRFLSAFPFGCVLIPATGLQVCSRQDLEKIYTKKTILFTM